MQINQDFIKGLRFNEKGLIPAIAQDWLDGAVLMMAWMNKDSLEKTIQTKEVHYWSRSRNQLWRKGATSGNTQTLKAIRYDCDSDALLLTIHQVGSKACHTGARSCFFQDCSNEKLTDALTSEPPKDLCSEVFSVIEDRKENPTPGSYTNSLIHSGENKILKKIGEETAEFVMACKDNEKDSISNEAADLIFHIQVALAHHKVHWRDVLEVLANRREKTKSQ
tara:strand:+ start:363 stop:1028 length:666 start_codon:yes stop_codon:yes gene_type:complete